MHHIYVLDRYTANYYKLRDITTVQETELSPKDFVVFEYEERGSSKTSVGQYLGYEIDDGVTRSGTFTRMLAGKELDYFHEKQSRALEKFPLFKKDFKVSFEGSKPVTARYQIFSHQTYFYFYSEQRYVFGDFVRNFQSKIGTSVFFFQVGSRDMVRLSHVVDERLDVDGRPLHYSYTWPLPSVEIDDIVMQWLEWRDIERLKDRSGRLKCSMIYERDTYRNELQNYPAKWQIVKIRNHEGTYVPVQCQSVNINTAEVFVRMSDWTPIRLPIDEVSRSVEEKKKHIASNQTDFRTRKNYWHKITKST